MPRYSFSKIKRYQEVKEAAEKVSVVKLPALRWTQQKDGHMELKNLETEQLEDEVEDISYRLFSREGEASSRVSSRYLNSRLHSNYPDDFYSGQESQHVSPRDQASRVVSLNPSPRISTTGSRIKQVWAHPVLTRREKKEEPEQQYYTGQEAYMQFYDKFRNIERVREHSPEGNSASSAYLLKLEELRLLPKPMGLVKKSGADKEINASHFKMGNEYASALAHSFKFLNPTKLNLHNNRISCKAAGAIVTAIGGTDCSHIDLSNNEIGFKGVTELAPVLENITCKIELLSLESNRLGDKAVSELANALKDNHSVVKLNLGHNLLTDIAASAIGEMLLDNIKLETLYLHWNKIRAKGGTAIARALRGNRTLKILDLGQNSIGSCASESASAASALAEALEMKGSGLIHLDLSHNQIDANNTAVIAKGLESNHTLLGFHYFGNSGYIDPKGFLRVREKQTLKKKQEIINSISLPSLKLARQIQSPPNPSDRKTATGGGIRGLRGAGLVGKKKEESKMLSKEERRKKKAEEKAKQKEEEEKRAELIKQENERIEQEMKQRLQSQIQANLEEQHELQCEQLFHNLETRMASNTAGDYAPLQNCWICEGWRESIFSWTKGESGPAQLSIDPIYIHFDFEDYVPQLMTKVSEEKWEIYRMIPPRRVKFFFSLQQRAFAAKDQAREKSKQKVRVKFEYETHSPPATSSPVPALPSSRSGLSSRRSTAAEDQSEELEFKLTVINYMEIYRKSEVTGQNFHSQVKHCVPRPTQQLHRREREITRRPPWQFKQSLFASYQPDNEAILARCFEFDWEKMKMPRIKGGREQEVKEVLRSHYPLIKNCFKYWATHIVPGSVLSISFNTYNEFFIKYLGLIDNKAIKYSEGDTLFLTVNGKKQTPMNPATALVRHQFMEIILRLAIKRYFDTKQVKTEADAVQEAFKDYLLPKCSEYDVHGWRKERYWTQEIDNVLKAHLNLLHDVYDQYRGQNRKPGEDKFMKSDEFERIWIDCRLIQDLFTQRDVVLMFTNSVQTQVDELEYDRHLKATFIEFLEAFCRACDRISYAREEPDSARDETTVHVRKNQSLLAKIENVLPLVFNCCSRTFKLKYQWPDKDIDTGLYYVPPQAQPYVNQYAGPRKKKNLLSPRREQTPTRF